MAIGVIATVSAGSDPFAVGCDEMLDLAFVANQTDKVYVPNKDSGTVSIISGYTPC